MDLARTAGAVLKPVSNFDADQLLLRHFGRCCVGHVGEVNMPTDSLLLSIAVCGVFLGFAAVLAWVDHSTSRRQRDKVADRPASAAPSHKKAA
jgi:hypothetical protein